jgi:hypothetical protein
LHDFSTRAQRHRLQRRGRSAAVAAVLCFVAVVTVYGPHIAHSAPPPEAPVGVARLPVDSPGDLYATANPSHDLAIEMVAAGREGLELSARLTDNGGLIEVPIRWHIRDSSGLTVYAAERAGAEASLPPGDYAVDIRYGAVRLSSVVSLLAGNRLMVSYVLNAGGLRVLPRIARLGLPAAAPLTRIFALEGRDRGKLIAVNDTPGEVLRVPEGSYRIESRYAAGNALAVTDVTVRAGLMSAVEIDHMAGLARLAYRGVPDGAVRWQVIDTLGIPVASLSGPSADVILKPGTYTATADVAGDVRSATFRIDSGEALDIILGN